MFGEAIISCIGGPSLDESAEFTLPKTPWPESGKSTPKASQSSLTLPLSPKTLAPLVIPNTNAPPPQRIDIKQSSSNKLRIMEEGAPDVPPKSARMLDGRASPHRRNLSSATHPNTAPSSAVEGRNSPVPYLNSTTKSPSRGERRPSESAGSRSQKLGHRRGDSDGSVMDRGRPKRRAEGITIKTQTKRDASAEQEAFATLPSGVPATAACSTYDDNEIHALKKQAIGQAAKFEVLGGKHVDSLSRVSRHYPHYPFIVHDI